MSTVKSLFKDAQGLDAVPKSGSKGGEYQKSPMEGVPGRSGSGVAKELYYDTAVTTKSPSTSGIVKTPFKDASAD